MKEKIKELSELEKIRAILKDEGKDVVFTNGCFDLIHVGHVRYLQQAKELGDVLIVGVNSDSSVRQLKGNTRPIIRAEERMEILAALEMVNWVVPFSELTASNVLRVLQPEVYVKGGDYTPETLPEWSVVKEYGGQVKLVTEVKGRSTTDIIRQIKEG